MIGLDNKRAEHKCSSETNLIWNKFDDTLSRILLLKDKLLYQLVPKIQK